MSIKIGIMGYGNLGRGVEAAGGQMSVQSLPAFCLSLYLPG